jgi:hypothetical protein
MNKEKNMKIEEYEKRLLAFMLYKGYDENNPIDEDKLVDDIIKEGWLELPMERIICLLKSKGIEENEN